MVRDDSVFTPDCDDLAEEYGEVARESGFYYSLHGDMDGWEIPIDLGDYDENFDSFMGF